MSDGAAASAMDAADGVLANVARGSERAALQTNVAGFPHSLTLPRAADKIAPAEKPNADDAQLKSPLPTTDEETPTRRKTRQRVVLKAVSDVKNLRKIQWVVRGGVPRRVEELSAIVAATK